MIKRVAFGSLGYIELWDLIKEKKAKRIWIPSTKPNSEFEAYDLGNCIVCPWQYTQENYYLMGEPVEFVKKRKPKVEA